jgi:hypothetical protein
LRAAMLRAEYRDNAGEKLSVESFPPDPPSETFMFMKITLWRD